MVLANTSHSYCSLVGFILLLYLFFYHFNSTNYKCTHAQICACTRVHKQIFRYTYIHTHTHIHTQIYTYTHTHVYTYTHTYTYTYTKLMIFYRSRGLDASWGNFFQDGAFRARKCI